MDARREEYGVEVGMGGENTGLESEMWKKWRVEDGVRLDERWDPFQVSTVEL